MQRVYQQHNIRTGKEKVEIDFPTEYNTELQCLKMSEEIRLSMPTWPLFLEPRWPRSI
jgi:hypothetical protein